MKSILQILIIISFLTITSQNLISQNTQKIEVLEHAYFNDIYPLDKASNHYAELKKLKATKSSDFQWMDTISFPRKMYNSYALALSQITPTYLTNEQFDFLIHTINYPANSSEQTRAELEFLLEWQEKRSQEDVDKVLKMAKIGYWPDINLLPSHLAYEENLKDLFYECLQVVGEECNHTNYPATSKLLQGVMNDMRKMEFKAKYFHLRARPYMIEKSLKPLQIMRSPSFASGHTLWAYMQAFTFSELIPEKREQFLKIAYELGLSREIMGVHYPSDEEMARQLAHRMISLMWQTGKFQEDFKLAKAEWK